MFHNHPSPLLLLSLLVPLFLKPVDLFLILEVLYDVLVFFSPILGFFFPLLLQVHLLPPLLPLDLLDDLQLRLELLLLASQLAVQVFFLEVDLHLLHLLLQPLPLLIDL